ncbi:MAG: guanylate kinase [Terriglobia bacterium]
MGSRAILFIVSGPSGSGKTTLVEHLLRKLPNTMFSVSYTTRAPRAGEQNGREYHFVSRAEFEAMSQRGEFLEQARVFDDSYGTHRSYLEQAQQEGKDLILDIDVQGAAQVKALQPDAVSVFVLPPSCEDLKQRLRARGVDAVPVIERRLEFARREIREIDAYDYVVINDELARACAAVEAIAQAEQWARRDGAASTAGETLAAQYRREAQRERVSAILESFGMQTR